MNMDFPPISKPPEIERDKVDREKIEDFSHFLEDCSNNNEEIHVIEEAITSSPKKLAELYDKVSSKYRAILGVLLFVASSHIGFDSNETDKESHEQIVSFEQSAEKRDNMKKITGFDVEEEAKKIGRETMVYMPQEKTTLTIVHIGQTHTTSAEINYEISDKIIKSQSEIASFLLATSSQQTNVFVEGYLVEDFERSQKAGKNSISVRETVSHINNAQSFEEVRKEYNQIVPKFRGFSNYKSVNNLVAVINKATGDKLFSMGFKETSPLTYSMGDEVLKLDESGFMPKDKAYTIPNSIDSGVAGAAQLLSSEGKIMIKPAETLKGNSASFELRDKLTEKGKILASLFYSLAPQDIFYQNMAKENLHNVGEHSSGSIILASKDEKCRENIECQNLTKEIAEVDIPAIDKAVMNDREDIAIELIAKQAKSLNQHVFPIVYGSAHDFTRAIVKWNKAHPEEQFNLVTVK